MNGDGGGGAQVLRWVAPLMLLFLLASAFLFPIINRPDLPAGDAEKLERINQMFEEYRKSFQQVPALTMEEYLSNPDWGDYLVVDVRPEEEREVSMIPGAISSEEFESQLDRYNGRRIVFYCTIGYRSGLYAKELSDKDLRLFNLQGGILAWTHAGMEVENGEGITNRVHTYGPEWNLLPDGYEAVW